MTDNMVDISSTAGLIAMWLLTLNILMGLLLSTKYNPVRSWPHRKINIFKLHNWTGYTALAVAFYHPTPLLFSAALHLRAADLLLPLSNKFVQQNYVILGATAFYLTLFVVVTSYFRPRIGNRLWKKMHYTAYAAAAVLFVHGLLIDPTLKAAPPDLLDGEKIQVEVCVLLVISATAWRIRSGRSLRTAATPA